MSQLGWTITVARCVGCRACAVACMQELKTVKGVRYRRVIERQSGTYPAPKRQFVTMACFHCEKPACLMACPTSPNKVNLADPGNTITKDAKFGVVLINQDKCIGCKYCVAACPYGAPRFNPNTNRTEKCTLCRHRTISGVTGSPTNPGAIDSATANLTGKKPACAETCIGLALAFGEGITTSGTAPATFSAMTMTKPSVNFEWGWESPW